MVSTKDISILVVDDDPDILSLIVEKFDLFGFKTYSAENGKKALDFLGENKVNIVITDIRMPVMNGFELLKAIKKKNPEFPKVFAITGYSDYSLEQLYHEGVDGFFYKPFDATAIKNCIKEALLKPSEKLSSNINHKLLPKVTQTFETFSGAVKQGDFGMGRNGFFLHLKENLPEPGEAIYFEVLFKNEGEFPSLRGVGRVRWTRRKDLPTKKTGIGVEFVSIEPDVLPPVLSWQDKVKTAVSIPMS